MCVGCLPTSCNFYIRETEGERERGSAGNLGTSEVQQYDRSVLPRLFGPSSGNSDFQLTSNDQSLLESEYPYDRFSGSRVCLFLCLSKKEREGSILI